MTRNGSNPISGGGEYDSLLSLDLFSLLQLQQNFASQPVVLISVIESFYSHCFYHQQKNCFDDNVRHSNG